VIEMYRAQRAFDARAVYDVWIRLVQSEALYDAMLRREHAALAQTLGFSELELAILEDFAIQPGTRWHVENLRFRAVTMVSRLLGWHLPATLRLVTEGRPGWLRDLVYEYLSLHRWVELGHHRRFAECERFATFVEDRVLKRRMPPPHVEAVLAWERGLIGLTRRAAMLPIAAWPARGDLIATPGAPIVRGPVQVQLALPVDLLAWLREPTIDLHVTAPGPVDVLAYVVAADASPELEPVTAIGTQVLAATAAPCPRDELERVIAGAGPVIASWLARGILVSAPAGAPA
jgi:hypothetical protein